MQKPASAHVASAAKAAQILGCGLVQRTVALLIKGHFAQQLVLQLHIAHWQLKKVHLSCQSGHGRGVLAKLCPEHHIHFLQAPLEPLGLALPDEPGLPLLGGLVGAFQAHGLPVPLQPPRPLLVRLLHALQPLGFPVPHAPHLPLLGRLVVPPALLGRALALQALQPHLQGLVLAPQGPLAHAGGLCLEQLTVRRAVVAHQEDASRIHRGAKGNILTLSAGRALALWCWQPVHTEHLWQLLTAERKNRVRGLVLWAESPSLSAHGLP